MELSKNHLLAKIKYLEDQNKELRTKYRNSLTEIDILATQKKERDIYINNEAAKYEKDMESKIKLLNDKNKQLVELDNNNKYLETINNHLKESFETRFHKVKSVMQDSLCHQIELSNLKYQCYDNLLDELRERLNEYENKSSLFAKEMIDLEKLSPAAVSFSLRSKHLSLGTLYELCTEYEKKLNELIEENSILNGNFAMSTKELVWKDNLIKVLEKKTETLTTEMEDLKKDKDNILEEALKNELKLKTIDDTKLNYNETINNYEKMINSLKDHIISITTSHEELKLSILKKDTEIECHLLKESELMKEKDKLKEELYCCQIKYLQDKERYDFQSKEQENFENEVKTLTETNKMLEEQVVQLVDKNAYLENVEKMLRDDVEKLQNKHQILEQIELRKISELSATAFEIKKNDLIKEYENRILKLNNELENNATILKELKNEKYQYKKEKEDINRSQIIIHKENMILKNKLDLLENKLNEVLNENKLLSVKLCNEVGKNGNIDNGNQSDDEISKSKQIDHQMVLEKLRNCIILQDSLYKEVNFYKNEHEKIKNINQIAQENYSINQNKLKKDYNMIVKEFDTLKNQNELEINNLKNKILEMKKQISNKNIINENLEKTINELKTKNNNTNKNLKEIPHNTNEDNVLSNKNLLTNISTLKNKIPNDVIYYQLNLLKESNSYLQLENNKKKLQIKDLKKYNNIIEKKMDIYDNEIQYLKKALSTKNNVTKEIPPIESNPCIGNKRKHYEKDDKNSNITI